MGVKMMAKRFILRQYLIIFLKVIGGMLVGTLVALSFHSDPFAGEAAGGIVALGLAALETYSTARKQC